MDELLEQTLPYDVVAELCRTVEVTAVAKGSPIPESVEPLADDE